MEWGKNDLFSHLDVPVGLQNRATMPISWNVLQVFNKKIVKHLVINKMSKVIGLVILIVKVYDLP